MTRWGMRRIFRSACANKVGMGGVGSGQGAGGEADHEVGRLAIPKASATALVDSGLRLPAPQTPAQHPRPRTPATRGADGGTHRQR